MPDGEVPARASATRPDGESLAQRSDGPSTWLGPQLEGWLIAAAGVLLGFTISLMGSSDRYHKPARYCLFFAVIALAVAYVAIPVWLFLSRNLLPPHVIEETGEVVPQIDKSRGVSRVFLGIQVAATLLGLASLVAFAAFRLL